MGYPLDTAAQDAALDALLSGDTSGLPSVWEVALFDGRPSDDGAELDATGGYARVLLNADLSDFPAAADGLKSSITVTFPDPTDAWSDEAPWALLIDHADSTTRWFEVPLTESVNVLAAGDGPSVVLTFFWNAGA